MAKKSTNKSKFDTTEFNRMLFELVNIAGAKYIKDVIRNELKAVCEKSAKQVKSANANSITERYTLKGSVAEYKKIEEQNKNPWVVKSVNYPVQNAKLVGQIKFEGNSKFKIPHDVNSSNISRVKKRLSSKKARVKKRIGLGKSTFVFMAKALGIKDGKFPAKATKAYKANPDYGSTVKASISGYGYRTKGEFDLNSETLTLGLGGRMIVQNNLNGRVKYFEINYKKKLFNDLVKASSKYGFEFQGS